MPKVVWLVRGQTTPLCPPVGAVTGLCSSQGDRLSALRVGLGTPMDNHGCSCTASYLSPDVLFGPCRMLCYCHGPALGSSLLDSFSPSIPLGPDRQCMLLMSFAQTSLQGSFPEHPSPSLSYLYLLALTAF